MKKKAKKHTIYIGVNTELGTVHCGSCEEHVQLNIGPTLYKDGAVLCNTCGETASPVLAALIKLADVARWHYADHVQTLEAKI